MKFMMMVKGNKEYEAGAPPDPRLMAAVGKHSAEVAQAGVLLQSGGLLPSSAGAKVFVSGGEVRVVDGPFAEAKEIIGGFAILQASSKAEAIEMARNFMQLHADILGPNYEGELEVRQLV
jgi:hypothetical protein